jgi:hypothetical protein
MGAWGEKAFENDSALDWLAELEAGGVHAVRTALETVTQTDEGEYLDVDAGAHAIAAAEIVAVALGQAGDRVPPQVASWLEANAGAVDTEDLALARKAVERVLAANSELRGLWDDIGASTPWHADVMSLLTRLGGNPSLSARPVARASQTLPHLATPKAAGQHEQLKAALLTFLRTRGLEPDEQQIEQIRASHDEEEIRVWLSRAIDARSMDAVLRSR